jgi:hypothetical protein
MHPLLVPPDAYSGWLKYSLLVLPASNWGMPEKLSICQVLVAHALILTTQETKIRRISVWNQFRLIVLETLSRKYLSEKKGCGSDSIGRSWVQTPRVQNNNKQNPPPKTFLFSHPHKPFPLLCLPLSLGSMQLIVPDSPVLSDVMVADSLVR